MRDAIRQLLLRRLSHRRANQLRKFKWAVLRPFENDAKIIAGMYHSEREIRVLERLVPEGATVLDIGANIGAYSVFLARFVGPRGTVHCFEPRSDTARRLRRSLLELPQCRIHQAGLSDHQGTGKLFLPTSHGLSSLVAFPHFDGFGTEEVKLTTLDEVVGSERIESIFFMKVDVEGYELEVFEGAHRTLTRFMPLVLAEIENRHLEPQGRSARDVFAKMRSHGYVPYRLTARDCVVVEDEMPEAVPGPEDLEAYNYWFVPGSNSGLAKDLGALAREIAPFRRAE